MRNINNILFLTLVLLLTSLGFSTAHAYDNFTIETYIVNINVLEENKLEIEEIIYADFIYDSHGIYREIETKGIMSRWIGDELVENKYNAIISDIYVENHKFKTSREGSYQTIKIGDIDKWINGMQKYHIKYTLDFGDDGIDEFDEFYLNVIGTGWNTNIKSVAISVTMPKEFNQDNIGISTGYVGESGSSIVKYETDGNNLTIHTTDALYPYQGMTLRIELPEGYFKNERLPFDWTKTFYYGVGGLVLLVALTWLIRGRDDKLYPTVEFYPPDDLPPAEVGYIIDGYVDTKDILSLLIYWADKGYIKIVETNNNDFYIIKLKSLKDNIDYYQDRLFIDLFKNKAKKDYKNLISAVSNNDSLTEFYRFLIEKQEKNEILTYVRVKDLHNVFYTTIENVKSKIRKKYTKKESGRIFTSKSIWAKVLSFIVCTWPIFFGNILIKSKVALYLEDAIMGGIFWCAVLMIFFIATDQLVARRKSMKQKSRKILFVIFGTLFVGLGYFSFIILADGKNDLLTGYVSVGATFLIALFAMFMQKRTDKINKLHEKILGLRMFLINAEQDRIEKLVYDNPDYFFNILSYAYALGVTDKWAKQFERIATRKPDWYVSSSTNNYFHTTTFTRNFTNNINTMKTTMTSKPSSSSSSSSGGGYSGGGGFSGGGGGGGGGGSW